MNISNIEIASIKRIVAHQIIPKTTSKDAYIIPRKDLLKFSETENEILIRRILEAINNGSKTFQLSFEDKSNDSLFEVLKRFEIESEIDYISTTVELAEKLADAHFRTNIPGGYCLIGEGITSKKQYFLFIIKAELQEAFNIESGKLNLIKDVFLSPAKDFYKVGFFIKNKETFIPFMYDDQFTMQKKDLTEYFYSQFLGLTTDENDKLKSKNFFEDTKDFIEKNIDNLEDRLGLLGALKTLYREDARGLISAKDFSEQYLEGKLKTEFDKKIVTEKYPLSFIKINTLLDKRLQLDRVTIPLSYNLSITGSLSKLGKLDIINDPSEDSLRFLQMEINTGSVDKVIIIKKE